MEVYDTGIVGIIERSNDNNDSSPFFDHLILNFPYKCPKKHWELDGHEQPTQRIQEKGQRTDFFTPIPKKKKQKDVTRSNIFDLNRKVRRNLDGTVPSFE
jgi:hypothetical protein